MMILTPRAFGISIDNPGCSPRSLHLVIYKLQYFPSCWGLWNLCSSLQAPSGCSLLRLLEFSPVHGQVGFIKGIEVFFFFFFLADNQGSFFAGLPSVIICSQLAWQPKLSFSPSRKTSLLCVLFPCNTVTKLVLNEKVRWMWVTCCASLLSRTLELIAAQCLKTFKSCHGKYIQVYPLSAAAW